MIPQRIVRPTTAFSVASTKQRRPREQDPKHLVFIRSLKCCICGIRNPEAAHIRSSSDVHGKRETGGGEKPSDKWVVPLCRVHHDEQHAAKKRDDATSELTWWVSKRIDPFGLALSLYAHSGDDELAESILNANRPRLDGQSSR
jgi:hypothetical protein